MVNNDLSNDEAIVRDTKRTGLVKHRSILAQRGLETLRELDHTLHQSGQPAGFDEVAYAKSKKFLDLIAQEIGNLTGDISTDLRNIILTLKNDHGLTKEGVVKLVPYIARYLFDAQKARRDNVAPESGRTFEESGNADADADADADAENMLDAT